MSGRTKFVLILLSMLLVVGMIASVGVTAAFWSASGAARVQTSVSPVIDGQDWNVWAKYFSYETVEGGIYITKFKTQADAETLFNNYVLIIPRSIDEKSVVGVSGSAFSDTVLKEMIEEIRIPNTVTNISASAFAGFVNLKRVSFETGSHCTLEEFAFAGTTNLAEVFVGDNALAVTLSDGNYVYSDADGGELTFAENAFFGSAYTPLFVAP